MSTVKRHLVFYAVIVAFLLSSCSGSSVGVPVIAPQRTSTPTPVTFNNEGVACFYALSESVLRIGASAERADLCWSSSCTLVLEEDYDIVIDQENFTIQLTWHVVAREDYTDRGGDVACTANCGGPGYWWYETEDLKEGEYSVKIGEKTVGVVNIPPQSPGCFNSYEEVSESPLPTQIPLSPLPISTP